MSTRIRVNVSGELIARAKRQAEAARFLRLEQQQLRAAGAQIAVATAQERQAPSGGRSFWQSRGRRGAGLIEEPIAFKRKEIAFIAFWLRGGWYGVITNGIYDPLPECRITIAVPSRNYVSDPIDIVFQRDFGGPNAGNDQIFISNIRERAFRENGWAGYLSLSSAQRETIRSSVLESRQILQNLFNVTVGSLAIPDLAPIPAFGNGSVSEIRIESKYLIPMNAQSRIFLTWGKLGQYINAVELPSSPPEVYTYTMTWLKQQKP